MQRIIYLLVFFSVVTLMTAALLDRPGRSTETAQAAVSEQAGSDQLPRKKSKARPPLYRPGLRPDGHLKIKPAVNYNFSSPFDAERQAPSRDGTLAAVNGLRLTGLARSSRGIRAVFEQGQKVIALYPGETKSGITLREIDEGSRTVLIQGTFGERVLSLEGSPP